MSMPGFTAEASLAKIGQRYILTPGAPAETGSVLPQGCFCTTRCIFNFHGQRHCFTTCVGACAGGPVGHPN